MLDKEFLKDVFYRAGSLASAVPGLERFRGCGAILAYHRVLPKPERERDRSPNAYVTVSKERFEEQIQFFAENYRAVSLDEVPGAMGAEAGEFFVAVTFDDGYRDNLEYALPILEKYQVPATIYISTGFIGNGEYPWWLRLAEALFDGSRFELSWNGRGHEIPLPNDAARTELFRMIEQWMKSAKPEQQAKLKRALAGSEPVAQGADCFLSWEEVRALSANPLITLGAHTRSHPNLSVLSVQDALEEVLDGASVLERELGHAVEHFAYPYGATDPRLLREPLFCSRFRTAVTMFQNSIFPDNHLLLLPRLTAREQDDPKRLGVRLCGLESTVRLLLSR